MATFVDKRGVAVTVGQPVNIASMAKGDVDEFVRALMVKLVAMGVSERRLAKIFNVGQSTINCRLQAIPPDKWAQYEAC